MCLSGFMGCNTFFVVSSMPQVTRHLTLRELERRYKKAKDPVEKTRFQAVYHAAKGLSAKEIARIT